MSDGPPRGMRQSTTSRELHELDRGLVAHVVDEHARASAGRPALATPSRSTSAMARFERERARRARAGSAALPDFRQRPAASLVTLGRFS